MTNKSYYMTIKSYKYITALSDIINKNIKPGAEELNAERYIF